MMHKSQIAHFFSAKICFASALPYGRMRDCWMEKLLAWLLLKIRAGYSYKLFLDFS